MLMIAALLDAFQKNTGKMDGEVIKQICANGKLLAVLIYAAGSRGVHLRLQRGNLIVQMLKACKFLVVERMTLYDHRFAFTGRAGKRNEHDADLNRLSVTRLYGGLNGYFGVLRTVAPDDGYP